MRRHHLIRPWFPLLAVVLCSSAVAMTQTAQGADDYGRLFGRLLRRLVSRRAVPMPEVRQREDRRNSTTEPAADSAISRKNPLAGCQMCHVDVEDEYLGSAHHQEKVGCVDCHGPSAGHLADENNEVKPDQRFARADVDRLCGVCHECPRDAAHEEKTPPENRPPVCVDCHGPHDQARLEPKPTASG